MLCARTVYRCIAIASLLCGGGCATIPVEQTGVLSSYQKLETSDGILTHARNRREQDLHFGRSNGAHHADIVFPGGIQRRAY
jgi:hypothetical protein